MPLSGTTAVRRSIVGRLVTQACILTTFVIVVLSTVGFVLAQVALRDVVDVTGIPADAGARALEPGLEMLSRSFTIVGTLLVGFTAATAYLLARRVTDPLRAVATKVGTLKPGGKTERTVSTGDEVEVLDAALADMSERLATVHAHQEDEIAARTEDLRKQFELDRIILDNIHLGVVTVDRSGTIALANPAALELLKIDAAVGKKVDETLLLRGHGGTPLSGEHAVLQHLSAGTTFRTPPSTHWSLERPDKSLLPVALSVVPLRDGQKSFGALVMFQNVSEERHIDYLKSEFITLASHQLRTPLSAIRWYAELLGDASGGLGDAEKEYVKEIDHSVRRMITLLGALLHAARIEDEAVRPTFAEANLASIVHETARDGRDTFDGASIALKVDAPSAAVMIHTDPVLLRVVLQNLLSNAAKYSPKGSSVEMRLSVEGGTAVVTVADHGMGIPAADQERIFEKFFRAQNVRQVDTDGNGLGLYISKSIVERLGGDLSFTSVEGKGTTFSVALPVTVA